MPSLNRMTVIGHLGRNADVKTLDSGAVVVSFTVAASEKFTNRAGDLMEETEWFRVTAWDKVANAIAPHLTKGSTVLVEGPLKTRTWKGKDGEEKSDREIRATRVLLLNKKAKAEEDEVPFA